MSLIFLILSILFKHVPKIFLKYAYTALTTLYETGLLNNTQRSFKDIVDLPFDD